MADQTNASLKIIQAANACFGTMRFVDACEATHFQYNIMFSNGQLPSIYCADDPAQSDNSVRLRPRHKDGFCAIGAQTRLYFAVAGLTGQIQNLETALSTDMALVGGPVYQSRYYVFVRLGVDRDTIQGNLGGLIHQATAVTTQQLIDLNAAREDPPATQVLYVNQGALLGTFWVSKLPYWTTPADAAPNRLYRPLDLIDFEIEAEQVPVAQGDDMAAVLDLVPEDDEDIHYGHSLITGPGLQAYYGAQNYDNGRGGTIPGATIWANLFRLGAFKQYHGLSANGVAGAATEILPDAEIYSLDMFDFYPDYSEDRDDDAKAALQLPAICNMISNFVDN
ncbi:MAG: hypothetical protein JJ902_02650 [Roseibium sp.]|nr:hypothetical protein [Roseibium sp.]